MKKHNKHSIFYNLVTTLKHPSIALKKASMKVSHVFPDNFSSSFMGFLDSRILHKFDEFIETEEEFLDDFGELLDVELKNVKDILLPTNENLLERLEKKITKKREYETIKIIILNAEYGKDYTKIIKEINKRKPDVVLMTEIDKETKLVKELNLPQIIAKQTNMSYSYFPEFYELNQKQGEGFTGNIILSKKNMSNIKAKRLKNYFPWEMWHFEQRLGTRNALSAQIKEDGINYGFVITHLEDKTSPKRREEQFIDILKWAKQENKNAEYIIIAGDFNFQSKKEKLAKDKVAKEYGFSSIYLGNTHKTINSLHLDNLFPMPMDNFYIFQQKKIKQTKSKEETTEIKMKIVDKHKEIHNKQRKIKKQDRKLEFKAKVLKKCKIDSDHFPIQLTLKVPLNE